MREIVNECKRLIFASYNDAMTGEQRKRTISRLNGTNQVDAFEAAKAVWEDSDARLERSLILTLKNGRRPFNRAAAAFAMQMVTTPKTVRALESVVKNKSERPRVRGEAAEALTHHHRKKSHDVLLAGLTDSSKDVRFWCAFALGEMAEKRAIPPLKLLVASDRRIVKGFIRLRKKLLTRLTESKPRGKIGERAAACIAFGD